MIAYEKALRFGGLAYFDGLGLAEITVPIVLHMQEEVLRERGPAIANHCVTLVRLVYAYALRRGTYAGTCPAAHVPKLHTPNRRYPLSPDDARRVWVLLFELIQHAPGKRSKPVSRVMAGLIAVLAATGIRRGEAQAIRSEDVDRRRRVLVIHEHKTARIHGPKYVPLTDETIMLIDLLGRTTGRDGWLFPSYAACGHVVEPSRAWKRVKEHLGIDPCTRIHDIRHGFATAVWETSRDLKATSAAMNHRSIRTTEDYVHPSLATIRSLVSKAQGHFLGGGTDG